VEIQTELSTGFFRFLWQEDKTVMTKFLLWVLLFIISWPAAILALILYPLVWLILLPFRLLGITVSAVLDLFKAIITLPARVLRGFGD